MPQTGRICLPEPLFQWATYIARCTKCGDSCGDDLKTRTKYKEEKNVGDRLKVVLLQIFDMVDIDNLQVAEIKSLLNTLVDVHVEETEE